ncbi:carboxymuconolactone decarboxylase family protein [Sedimenticola sp.]|uniref:carboxymuconolactone decarboxylase family protein n=1 Tax=Sedimenticola sp. TaxID=1940285 RepID=UPI003D10BFA4
MAISSKEREIGAVGISIAAGCKPCTDFHVKKAREVGASDAEIKQAMTDAVSVRRDAADIMEAYGLAHFGGDKPSPQPGQVGATDRVKELVFIGAAFAVNCVSTMKAHLEAAENLGIPHEDITTIVKLSAFIKGKAASHVEHLAETIEKPEEVYGKEVSACC